ncbi:MAG: PspC family transcriptional regulator [Chitinophagales bacterium]|nr:PspC family transcriptional regulator [Chitinophagales bacterium]
MLEKPSKLFKSRSLRDVIEMSVYGVCSYLGRKLSMPSKRVRLFFIYTSFIALGSPIIIYLILTFVLNLRYMINNKRNPVWDI